MYAWAADPDRGGLMPDGFRNPFVRGVRQAPAGDLFGEPDISVAEACRFFEACDAFQLRLFAPMALYGLRAAELCYLFFEDLDERWLHVGLRPEATLKDFRHLASTLMENAGVPEHYRKYLLGQSPGTAPITRYTHLGLAGSRLLRV